jgi:type IV secretory pathway TraG/TraD family ATPase VirD4
MEGALGSQEAEMIISNLSNQFYGRTTNPKTAQRVSGMFGKKDVEYSSYSRGDSSKGLFDSNTRSKSISTSVQQRDRLEVQEVIRFATGKFAGFIAEGNKTEFIGRFAEHPSKAKEIPPFKNVSDQDKRENFSRIKSEVRSILSNNDQSSTRINQKIELSNNPINKDTNWEDFS